MKELFKRLLLLTICLTLPLCLMCSCETETKEEPPAPEPEPEPDPLYYINIGDSIAAGYALPSYTSDYKDATESYTYLLKQSTSAEKYRKLAVTGSTTSETLTYIKSYNEYKYFSGCNFITLAIGSNDLLGTCINILCTATSCSNTLDLLALFNRLQSSEDPTELQTIVNNIKNEFNKESTQKTINDAIETYKTNFIQIVDNLTKYCTNLELYVVNYFNPYEGIEVEGFKVGDYVQSYLDILNDFVKNHAYNNTKYYIADVSQMKSSLTNVSLDFESGDINVDPHPNVNGHKYIYDQIVAAIKSNKNSKITITEN